MTDMALIPYADYKAAADQARTLRGTSAAIKSGELPGMLEAANTEVDTQTGLINELIEKANSLPEAGSGGGAEPVIQALEVTENGTYTPPEGVDGYSPVTVAVPESGGEEWFWSTTAFPYTATFRLPDSFTGTFSFGVGSMPELVNLDFNNAIGVTELNFRAGFAKIKTIKAPKFSALGRAFWLSNNPDMDSIDFGSIGYPITSIAPGCFQYGVGLAIITVYVDAGTLGDIPSNVINNAPWGAKNATIVYRNSTTGEVITA